MAGSGLKLYLESVKTGTSVKKKKSIQSVALQRHFVLIFASATGDWHPALIFKIRQSSVSKISAVSQSPSRSVSV